MAPATRRTFALLLAIALIALTSAGWAHADIAVSPTGQWQFFQFYTGSSAGPYSVTLPEAGYLVVTDAYCAGDRFGVVIDGHDRGQTSAPTAETCDVQVRDNADKAMTMSEYSHGVFPLVAGKSSFTIKTTHAMQPGGAYFKLGLGVYVDSALATTSGFKVITTQGKVSTRAAAANACSSAGMALADVTATNWAAVVNAVRASTSMSLNPSDAVLIGSWNGDSFGGSNLQLTVQRDASGNVLNAGITLATAAHYPLCQPALGPALPSSPTVVQRSGDLAVVGPAGKAALADQMCVAALGAGAVPVTLSGARTDEFKTASTLAFNAAGPNSQVWIAGWEAPANGPMVLATGPTSGGGAVVVPENPSDNKLYLCKTSGTQRRSEL
ncbi:hypothetical protein GGF31_006492 [Allomyces arbusculus]|nr:hypothetical protein GGF31_006492 [Allomyces arbusculus]